MSGDDDPTQTDRETGRPRCAQHGRVTARASNAGGRKPRRCDRAIIVGKDRGPQTGQLERAAIRPAPGRGRTAMVSTPFAGSCA